MKNAGWANITPPKKGEVRNPNGRPVGSKHKFSETFLKDFMDNWERNGKEAIEALCAESPKDYVKVGVEIYKSQIVKQVNLTNEPSGLSGFDKEQLTSLLALNRLLRECGAGDIEGAASVGDGSEPTGIH